MILSAACLWGQNSRLEAEIKPPFERLVQSSPASIADQFRAMERAHLAAGYVKKSVRFTLTEPGDESKRSFTYVVQMESPYESRNLTLQGNLKSNRGVISYIYFHEVNYGQKE